jgi:hypothetical protein
VRNIDINRVLVLHLPVSSASSEQQRDSNPKRSRIG